MSAPTGRGQPARRRSSIRSSATARTGSTRTAQPYLPVGDGGIVLGLQSRRLGLRPHADHAAPGACLIHPDPAARHALCCYSCIGNQVKVRTGAAAGASGAVHR